MVQPNHYPKDFPTAERKVEGEKCEKKLNFYNYLKSKLMSMWESHHFYRLKLVQKPHGLRPLNIWATRNNLNEHRLNKCLYD